MCFVAENGDKAHFYLYYEREKMSKFPNKKEIKQAFVATIPVLTGYIFLGMGFGMMLYSKGFGAIWAFFMSLTIFAGSLEYAAVDLLASSATIITTAVVSVALNARHVFYGISLIDKYKGVKKKTFLIFGLTDETYSLVCNDVALEKVENKENYYFLVTLFDHIYWITGSVLGALVGAILPFSTEGIDFVLTALFLTVFVEQWLSTKNHLSAISGVLATIVALLIFGADNFLIPAMILIALALTLLRKKEGITND